MVKLSKAEERQLNKAAIILVLLLLAFVQFVFFGLLTLIYHRQLMARYFKNDEGYSSIRRINDFKAVFKPLVAIAFGPPLILLLCAWPFLLLDHKASLAEVGAILLLESPFLLLWLWLSIIFFKWLAVAHFGVIVDPEKDRIVFQFDQESYDFSDYLKLKFIRDLPKMDEVRLSEIGRITRKTGFDLYILGSFGSRRISFTNKQKRDECIYAITSSGCAKVTVEFDLTCSDMPWNPTKTKSSINSGSVRTGSSTRNNAVNTAFNATSSGQVLKVSNSTATSAGGTANNATNFGGTAFGKSPVTPSSGKTNTSASSFFGKKP